VLRASPVHTSLPTEEPRVGTEASLTPTSDAVSRAQSGIVEQTDLQRLVRGADFILIGSVVGIKSEWNPERTRIHTDIGLSVETCLKGASRLREVTIRLSGGRVGDVVQSVSTAPEFHKGEKVLVFLEPGEEDTLRVVGAFQGKVTLHEGTAVQGEAHRESLVAEIGQIMRETGISAGVCTGD
jgi:hypothetical protein